MDVFSALLILFLLVSACFRPKVVGKNGRLIHNSYESKVFACIPQGLGNFVVRELTSMHSSV